MCRVSGWPLALGALLGSATLVQEAHQAARPEVEEENPGERKGFHLLDASTRRRTFYKYERRIRDFSQPDKVFHYFANRTLADGTRSAEMYLGGKTQNHRVLGLVCWDT
jgi:hypothetical protein